MIYSIKRNYQVKSYDEALVLVQEKTKLINHCDDKLFQYLWKKRGCFDGFELGDSSLLIPCIETSNNFLSSLFCQYPNLSEKQMEWWKKIVGDMYYYNETDAGKEEIKRMDEGLDWLEKILKECNLSIYDKDFIHRFYKTAKVMRTNNRKLTDKQMTILENTKRKYWKQYQKKVIEKI